MELSLRFIAEKLRVSYDIDILNENPEVKYGTVRLFDPSLAPSSRFDPIVVASSKLKADSLDLEMPGVIWVGMDRPMCACPTIWVHDNVSEVVILTRVMNLFDLYNTWLDQVRNALLKQETFSEVVPLLEQATTNPFYYADASMRTLAISEDQTLYASSSAWRSQMEVGRHPVEKMAKWISTGELDIINQRRDSWFVDSDTFHIPFISRTIFLQGDVFGHLFIVQVYPGQEVFDTEILEAFGTLLERHLELSSLSYSSSGRPFEPMLISQLELPGQNENETKYLLKLLSWRPDDSFQIIVFDLRGEKNPREFTKPEIQVVEDNLTGARAFLHKGRLVAVVNNAHIEGEYVEKTTVALCIRFGWKAAISNTARFFADLSILYRQACMALDKGMEIDPMLTIYPYREYELSLICSALLKHANAELLMHNDLRTLVDYDRQNGSDLVATLKAYLDNERNVSKTADALFMHRNSIKYRLEKIESLLTSDLNDADNRLLLLLAINTWNSYQQMELEP